MREATYFILLSLLDGPMHGYGIARRAAELSDGRVKPAAGTLYGALERLSKQGLVEASGEESVNGRRRRYFTITESGRHDVVAEVARLRSAIVAAERSNLDETLGFNAGGMV